MPKNNKKIIWLGLTISLFFFIIFVFTKDISQNTSSISHPSPVLTQKEKTTQAFLEVNGQKLETGIEEKESVYDFMVKLKEEEKINFKDKTYTGMGKLIEEINGIKNSNEKNWIYYINGGKAQIGISNYKIQPGDVVSWKYEENKN
ncbi:hypothetical protein CO033_02565 [Candidatus Nomurabacteria bacterium CG_4_9_14_0_2_um_filter_32_10]|uniref:Transcobalamin-like C-terminal domain-containing protein n=3 Tax=Candidatus Nomuraibacteriota TaxID=1752729 RepID=A0A2H0CGZ5_9BACT|nr:MAG: hypothetical protein COW91_00815 [Candidatus Nomurabacteria bacterium CG22_combo_CG10-13_8_21_14_all_32_8]PIZ85469.1 MAG: hypothetical protein COX94_02625 [Candidatus Nomurabacteria bacterium CG_4_10_14_0_2_um_filter_33_9]PJC49256.1 MAG: hypothetical protein CO033_02565 [Candidatus Nomurabacteria bacterium CG_4_9_14_0_2_um_filter_32_10]